MYSADTCEEAVCSTLHSQTLIFVAVKCAFKRAYNVNLIYLLILLANLPRPPNMYMFVPTAVAEWKSLHLAGFPLEQLQLLKTKSYYYRYGLVTGITISLECEKGFTLAQKSYDVEKVIY